MSHPQQPPASEPTSSGQPGAPAGDGRPPAPVGWGAGPAEPAGYGTPQYGAPQPQYGTPQHGAPQPQYGAAQYGMPQQYGAPQYGAPGGGVPQGYRPPPVQRGVIPLRPLGLGEIFDGAFRSVRANPRVMFGLSAVVITIAVAIGTVLQLLVMPAIASAVAGLEPEMDPQGDLGMVDSLSFSLSTLVMMPTTIIATAVLSGLLTVSVSRSVIGQTVSAGELWGTSWRPTMLVVGFTLVYGLVTILVFGGFIAAVLALAGADQPGAAVALGLIGSLVLVVVSVWVAIRLLFVPAVMVLERTGLAAIPRAWRLTRGSFWRVLGIYLLTSLVVGLVSQVIVTPFAFIGSLAVLGSDTTSIAGVLVTNVGTALGLLVTIVFTASVSALLYIDLRIRREGLDVELSRAAESAATR